MVFSPDGKRLASAGGVLIDKPGELKVWDVATGGETVAFKGHSGGVVSVAFSPSGERVASASADGTIKMWDAATGQESRTLGACRLGRQRGVQPGREAARVGQ